MDNLDTTVSIDKVDILQTGHFVKDTDKVTYLHAFCYLQLYIKKGYELY